MRSNKFLAAIANFEVASYSINPRVFDGSIRAQHSYFETIQRSLRVYPRDPTIRLLASRNMRRSFHNSKVLRAIVWAPPSHHSVVLPCVVCSQKESALNTVRAYSLCSLDGDSPEEGGDGGCSCPVLRPRRAGNITAAYARRKAIPFLRDSRDVSWTPNP